MLGKAWPKQVVERYDDYWRIWRTQHKDRLAKSTEKHYSICGRQWCSFANGKSLNPGLMVEWHIHVSNLRSTLASKLTGPLTVQAEQIIKFHGILRKFLRWLKLMGLIQHDPSLALPSITKPKPGPPKLWLHHEYRKIVDYASEKGWLQPLLFLVVLGYNTGMGTHECCYLKWDEVVMQENGPCYIQKARSKLGFRMGQRAFFTVPIIPGGELWVMMKKLEARRRPGAIYVHDDLQNMYISTYPEIMHNLKGKLLIPALGAEVVHGRSFRNFRNSFCSRLINAGVDSTLVAKMTGHSDLGQLARYVMPNLRAMSDALVKAMRWAEDESNEEMPRHFLTLPSPPCGLQGASPSPDSSCAEERQ